VPMRARKRGSWVAAPGARGARRDITPSTQANGGRREARARSPPARRASRPRPGTAPPTGALCCHRQARPGGRDGGTRARPPIKTRRRCPARAAGPPPVCGSGRRAAPGAGRRRVNLTPCRAAWSGVEGEAAVAAGGRSAPCRLRTADVGGQVGARMCATHALSSASRTSGAAPRRAAVRRSTSRRGAERCIAARCRAVRGGAVRRGT
jgi:hypothetical protein